MIFLAIKQKEEVYSSEECGWEGNQQGMGEGGDLEIQCLGWYCGKGWVVGQAGGGGGERQHHQIHNSVEWEERLLVKYATQGNHHGTDQTDDSTGDGISGASTMSHSVLNPDEEDVQPLAIDYCEKERDDMDPTVIINELDGFGSFVAA